MNYREASDLARLITSKSSWFAIPALDQGCDTETDWQIGAKYNLPDGSERLVAINEMTMEAARLLSWVGWEGLRRDDEPDGSGWLDFLAIQGRRQQASVPPVSPLPWPLGAREEGN